jgi:putative ABC transport system substrate-binding protein
MRRRTCLRFVASSAWPLLAWPLTPLSARSAETHRWPEPLPQLLVQSAYVGEREPRAARETGNVAVFYPDIAEPYRSVFLQILEGIENTVEREVHVYPVGPQVNLVELTERLRRQSVRAVIALGRQGLAAASGLDPNIAVVVGGVLFVPEAEQKQLTGISLTPDPALLFERLTGLQPGVRRIQAVYDPRHNEWLMKLARDAATRRGLELAAHTARNLGEAVRRYEELFAAMDPRHDALWLPQDPTTVDENTVLPLVLKESWNRNIAVFSSSYVHVRKGVLFVLYPNNVELGRNLAASALKSLAGDARRGIAPLREVYMAVNLRTASHIGLTITHQQQRSFDSVFPGR